MADPHATVEDLIERLRGYGRHLDGANSYLLGQAVVGSELDDLADALAAELASVRADLEAAREALREARDGLREALDYGLRWPIGLDTDPQEQRGMDRDTFIRNTKLGIQQIDAALAAGTEGERAVSPDARLIEALEAIARGPSCICYPGECPHGCEPACPKCMGRDDGSVERKIASRALAAVRGATEETTR